MSESKVSDTKMSESKSSFGYVAWTKPYAENSQLFLSLLLGTIALFGYQRKLLTSIIDKKIDNMSKNLTSSIKSELKKFRSDVDRRFDMVNQNLLMLAINESNKKRYQRALKQLASDLGRTQKATAEAEKLKT
jgi:hypothetical protein